MTRRSAFWAIAIAMPVVPFAVDLVIEHRWEAPALLFWIVLVAASLCAIAALGLVVVAHRNEQAELGFVSVFYFAASMLSLAHGLTIPGFLYGPNPASGTAVFLVIPVGVLGVAPSLIRSTAVGRAIGRRWRWWAAGSFASTLVLAGSLLLWPNIDFGPEPGSGTAIAAVGVGYLITVFAGRRHLWLAEVAERNGPLVVAYGYLFLGASGLVLVSDRPWSAYFWLAHAFDIGGVFLATVGGVLVYIRRPGFSDLIRPVVAADPHSALELGLSPLMHRHVADLEAKDNITRDHVVRTCMLAIDVAVELNLSAEEVRCCGLVGLLHDVGKLKIADEILTKPGKLTDDEYEQMKLHTVHGSNLLKESPALAELAPAVRGHHERVDGRGYPDGLNSDDIPMAARVVAGCDAFDAMSFTRHYREGMSQEKVVAILREHSGAQWDPAVVDAVLTVTAGRPESAHGRRALDEVGRSESIAADTLARPDIEFGCDCFPASISTHR